VSLEAAKERAGLRLNMPPDAPGLRLILDDGSGCIDTTTGIVHRNMSACMVVEDSESEVERVRMEILAAIDNAMEMVSTVVSNERKKLAKRTSGNRRDGWSAQYGAIIADVRDLLAAVDDVRGATPELLAKLMQRVQRLSSVLELPVDCTGMSIAKVAKTVRQAAKHFLSSIHGRERNARCAVALRNSVRPGRL
jgi:hypothetical protein